MPSKVQTRDNVIEIEYSHAQERKQRAAVLLDNIGAISTSEYITSGVTVLICNRDGKSLVAINCADGVDADKLFRKLLKELIEVNPTKEQRAEAAISAAADIAEQFGFTRFFPKLPVSLRVPSVQAPEQPQDQQDS